MAVTEANELVRAASFADVRERGRLVVGLEGHTVCLIVDGDQIHAIDNRCPHMGFPLHRGTVTDGMLTCHWHHARFDLCSGGTFDQWADDLRRFPVELRGEDVYVDLRPRRDPVEHQRKRLRDGLERNIPLVLAKATITLTEADPSAVDAFRAGLDFGVERRGEGWGRGLTTLACLGNLVPRLERDDVPVALYHGLADVADEAEGHPPRFPLEPLASAGATPAQLGRWFRRFVEVRDAEGAERALVSIVHLGATRSQLANTLFAAATDHRYLDVGHALDFTNKALEALDVAGWDRAESILAAVPAQIAAAARMEEENAWRHPIDLVELLELAFERLPQTVSASRDRGVWNGRSSLVETVLEGDPAATVEALLRGIQDGATPVELASAVSFAAVTRIARFPTTNEFGDWDTALHTFTFANAVEQGLRRSSSPELLRGVFDGAMSVYVDRFLNVPATRLPEPRHGGDPHALLEELPQLLDRQQQVDEAAELVASYLTSGGHADALVGALGAALVRENRNFHTIQCVEAAVRQHELLRGTEDAALPLIAAARYLAAHATTTRSQRQTFDIARRLHRGERLYEEVQ
jgi:nitrite reductase/ring-hydroxylating ferredoxin subunit